MLTACPAKQDPAPREKLEDVKNYDPNQPQKTYTKKVAAKKKAVRKKTAKVPVKAAVS